MDKSKCCGAPVKTEGDTTKHYVCTKCNRPCDADVPWLKRTQTFLDECAG